MDETVCETVDVADANSPASGVPGPFELEQTCAQLEAVVRTTLESAKGVSSGLKKLLGIAQDGRVRELRKAAANCLSLAAQLQTQTAAAAALADFDQEACLSSASFIGELRAEARDRGLVMHQQGPSLYCFPHTIRVLPAEGAVALGRTREYRVRPSVLVKRLRDEQQKPIRFKPQQFLQVLYRAYLLVLPGEARDAVSGFVVPLSRLYEILTLFPGTSKDYTIQDFTRDIYLLDRSGVATTKEGAALSLPASTGTRAAQASLSVVTETGEETRYYGISFSQTSSAS